MLPLPEIFNNCSTVRDATQVSAKLYLHCVSNSFIQISTPKGFIFIPYVLLIKLTLSTQGLGQLHEAIVHYLIALNSFDQCPRLYNQHSIQKHEE